MLVALLLFLVLRAGTTAVPNVTGRSVAEAQAVLGSEGLEARPVIVTSGAPEGVVVGQDPSPGQQVDDGATVLLRVSGGPGVSEVPSVRNLPRRRAVQKLNEAGFSVEEEERDSTSIDRGLAIRTVPREGDELERGSRVRLIVSSGAREVEVPSVVGASLDSAEDELRDAGLDARVERIASDEPEDRVLVAGPGGRGDGGRGLGGHGHRLRRAGRRPARRRRGRHPGVLHRGPGRGRPDRGRGDDRAHPGRPERRGARQLVRRRRRDPPAAGVSGRALEIGRTVVIYLGAGGT